MKKEIPILFSTMMVQANLEDRKTMTRRTNGLDKINENPDKWVLVAILASVKKKLPIEVFRFENLKTGLFIDIRCPYGDPGDLLWVRESFTITGTDVERGGEGEVLQENPIYCFRGQKQPHIERLYKWKPSIHMPKAAARIWLEVVSIKVERLQDISEEDAKAEGIEKMPAYYKDYLIRGGNLPPYASFKSLWQSINGPESWNANPWVWVVKYKILSKTGKP